MVGAGTPAARRRRSCAETFAAGTGGGGVGIVDLETRFLQTALIIQLATGDIQRALGIHHHAHAPALHENVAISRAILQIHFILQTTAAAAHHRHAQDAIRAALALEQGGYFIRRARGQLHEAFVARAVLDVATGFSFASTCKHDGILRQNAL